MPSLTCYRLRPVIGGVAVQDFDAYINAADKPLQPYGPVGFTDFDAQLYVATSPPHLPDWAGFFQRRMGDVQIPQVRSVSAVLLVRLKKAPQPCFAFVFGVAGRYLLRSEAPERSYGLRAALNIVYPADRIDDADPARIVALESKRRSANPMRSRGQAARATAFEDFDVDRLRDVLSGFTGRPATGDQWGKRVTGGDAFSLTTDTTIDGLGKLCEAIDQAHERDDYRRTFPWIDNIRPVSDPEMAAVLETRIMESLQQGQLDAFGLAPPEMIDWERIDGFRFFYERPTARYRPCNPYLDLPGLVARLRNDGLLDLHVLKTHQARAINSDGHTVHEWSLWRCLFGEVVLDGTTYILDEGDFFQVDSDYLTDLNRHLDSLPECQLALPPSDLKMKEAEYNELVVRTLGDRALLLDARTVRLKGRSTPVEICDVLTDGALLIHVKRGLGSSHLSHLFAQGFVSAELLWGDREFRALAHAKVMEYSDTDRFPFFGNDHFVTRDFEIVFAIIANWRERGIAQALPFFSKINLRKTAEELDRRGYRISLCRIPTTA